MHNTYTQSNYSTSQNAPTNTAQMLPPKRKLKLLPYADKSTQQIADFRNII